MSLNVITNPYFLGYVAIILVLLRAGFGLKRIHEKNVERRKHSGALHVLSK